MREKISNLEKNVISILAAGCLGVILIGAAKGSKEVFQYGGLGFVALATYAGTKVDGINYRNKLRRLHSNNY